MAYFYLNSHDNANFPCLDGVMIFAPFQLLRNAAHCIWCHKVTTYLDRKDDILEEICLFCAYCVTMRVQCVRMEINILFGLFRQVYVSYTVRNSRFPGSPEVSPG